MEKLKILSERPKEDFETDPFLPDIVERNLEIVAQCIIDIANRIISILELKKPKSYYEAILILGKEGILPLDFATKLAPIAGFRNILIHEYLDIDWDEVYKNLKDLDRLYKFVGYIKEWLKEDD